MDDRIKVCCTRPMMLDGKRVEPGAELALSPLAAADTVASGRAVLADPADAARVNVAVVEQRDRMIRTLDAV